MTSCEYCERTDVLVCDGCDRSLCPDHLRETSDEIFLCVPPGNGPDAGKGCYKPPVGTGEGVPMTSCGYWSCEYCPAPAVARCETCDTACCPDCMVEGDDSGLDYCNPDPATWPGRGCYKSPVAEVADDSR